jgi:cell division protease FtsH
VAAEVDAEVRRLIEEGEGRAEHILSGWRSAIDRLAQALLEREELDGEELKAMLAEPVAAG